MVDNVYVYLVDKIPGNKRSMVTPCADGGYTILIDARLSYEQRLRKYEHELKHIESGAFDIDNVRTVQEIEYDAHIPDKVVPISKISYEISFLQKQRRKLNSDIRKKQRQIEFLKDSDFDFFAAAEARYLEP